jgi:hypothetical protein
MGRCIVVWFYAVRLPEVPFSKLMRLFVRYLLWILIAALPLQGGAVAFMSGNAERAQVSTPTHRMESATGDTHAQMSHEHCGDSSSKKTGLSHGKCPHCASCCVGAVAPPAVPAELASSTFSTFATSAGEPAMTAYIPATLERPPRHHA